MCKKKPELQSKHANALVVQLVMSHQFSVSDRQDGESLIRPRGAAQILDVAVGWQRWRLSFKFADLTFPFGGGPSAELADRVSEPLLQGAHRASGARGAWG